MGWEEVERACEVGEEKGTVSSSTRTRDVTRRGSGSEDGGSWRRGGVDLECAKKTSKKPVVGW